MDQKRRCSNCTRLAVDVECRLAFDAATKRAFLHTNHVRVMQQLHAPFCTPIMRPLFLLWPTYWVFKHNARTLCKCALLAHHVFSHGRPL
jgi:hypothetical protein